MDKNIDITKLIDLENRTIGEFEKVNDIIKDEIMDKHKFISTIIDILETLGIDDDIIDNLNIADISNIVKYFRENEVSNNFDNLPTNYIISDIEYKIDNINDFVVRGRMISNLFNRLPQKDFTSYCLACIFTNDDITKKENLDEELLKSKQKYIQDNLLVKDYIPYVIKVTEQIIDANTSNLNLDSNEDK